MFLIPAAPAAAYSPVWLEAQDWWNGPIGGGSPDSVAFPFRHVHLSVQVPIFDTVSGTVDVPFKALVHNNIGKLITIKWQDDVGDAARTIIIKPNVVLTDGDIYTGTFHIDTTKENDGNRLWRFYAIWQHDNGNQQVARPIYSIDVENGKPDINETQGNGIPGLKPTGWYKESGGFDWGYTQASLPTAEFPQAAITTTWQPEFKCDAHTNSGPAAPPIGSMLVHLDPDFHNGNSGTVIGTRTGAGKLVVTVNPVTLSSGAHKLVVRCLQDANGKHHEGVGVYPFTVQ